ncbi:UNVERIFIED_CONTAM: hypothetical protein Sradi_0476300 [Sesamum radiatum]|uniref:Uncharacterized protein n=1 Tax=Sesamum radiatum TaxID=300843 RepID=A0AAW2W8N1_SESRA
MSLEDILAKGVIHMIAGGPTDGNSGRARHAYAWAARAIMEIDSKTPAGDPVIHFGPADAQGIHLPHNDALVISATVANYIVQHIFVDSGSSENVFSYKVYQWMKLGNIPQEPVDISLYGFTGEVVYPPGQISFLFSLGMEPIRKTKMINFLVVDMPSAYNMILGWPALNAFLENINVFAWSARDLVDIDPSIVVHSLNLYPTFSMVKQKNRHFSPEKGQSDTRTGTTYQRLVDRMLGKHLGCNMEVYADDMLVKIRQIG